MASEISNPDAILVRSANMHDMAFTDSLKAVGRAGAGVNNIPVDRLSEKGIPVFQRTRCECQRGQGVGRGGHAVGLPQHLPGLGLRQLIWKAMTSL